MGDYFKSWRLVDKFSARELAALLSDLLPEVAAADALVPALRRIETDFKRAIYDHCEMINPSDLPLSELVTTVSPKALQSMAMIARSKPDAYGEFDPHTFWDWLVGNKSQVEGVSPDWQSPDVCLQWFSRDEIVRWLKANNIRSDFFLGTVASSEADVPIAEAERDKLLRQIGALSVLLAEKSTKYRCAGKPNASQISEAVGEMLDSLPDANKASLTGSPIRQSIAEGIARLMAIQK